MEAFGKLVISFFVDSPNIDGRQLYGKRVILLTRRNVTRSSAKIIYDAFRDLNIKRFDMGTIEATWTPSPENLD